jgi:hypothetical protein
MVRTGFVSGAIAAAIAMLWIGAAQAQARSPGALTSWSAERASTPVQTAAIKSACGRRYGPIRRGRYLYGRAFLHIWNKTCWSCPVGFNRTVDPNVKGPRACHRAGVTRYARARRHGRGTGLLHTDCPRGSHQFLHIPNGFCYSCPRGYRRTLAGINSPRGCARKFPGRFAAGLYRGPVPAPNCGGLNKRPCLIVERIPSCNRGLVEDFLINKCVRNSTSLRRLANQCFRRWKPVAKAMTSIAGCMVTSGITGRLGAALKGRRSAAVNGMLFNGPCGSKIQQVARVLRAAGLRTMTLGVGSDVAVGIGANSEFFVAVDTALLSGGRPGRVRVTRPYFYETLGWQLGVALGGSVNAVVGAYRPTPARLAGNGQGFSFSAKVFGGGGGALSLDYSPACTGLSVHAGAGEEVNAMSITRFKTVRLH